MVMDEWWDVVVAGAGPAGCTVAALLAGHGYRVLLLERGQIPHPRLCTHAIMPAGLPVLAELGVLDQVEAAGAQRWWGVSLLFNGVPIHAPLPAGWPRFPYGLSLRRQYLDPILLGAVNRQPAAEVRVGWSIDALIGGGGVVMGVRARQPDGDVRRIGARLVVAADGRHSRLARAARLPERVFPNRHIALIGYLAGVPREERPCLEAFHDHGRSASMLPADHGLRVVGVVAPPERWPRDQWPRRMLDELGRYPGMAERLRDARFVSDPVAVRGLRNVVRRPARCGFVAVGDAALHSDPAFGQGISWALRSGSRLARAAATALARGEGPVLVPAPAGIAWDPTLVPLFVGTSLLSAVPPASHLERLIMTAATASPPATTTALRLLLSLVATPRPAPPARIAAAWLRGALTPVRGGARSVSSPAIRRAGGAEVSPLPARRTVRDLY